MSANTLPEEKPVITFQIITDTHVTADRNHEYNLNFELALRDIAAHGKGSSGIMHIGDVTNHGFSAEYKEMLRIINQHKADLPDITFTLGNHDVGLGIWKSRLGMYTSQTGMSGPYHDHWINGYHFIFLGTEKDCLNSVIFPLSSLIGWSISLGSKLHRISLSFFSCINRLKIQ